MIYGFISSLDGEATKVFFRSKKICVNNIYNAGSLGELTSVLQSGDVVYTVSCNRFASVRQVYTFARFCHERGIILHFVAEPYLDMGNGKQWRPAVTMLDTLPDACTNDAYWSLGQLVNRRDNIMKQRTRLVNQLHEQLCIAYPSYKLFFDDISRPTALYFWEHYPSRKYLKGKSVEDLREELVPVSHNRCSTKICENILNAVVGDKVKDNDYQDARDVVTHGIVSDLQHYDTQLKEVDKQLEQMYHALGCMLTTIPGVNIITAVKILAEIGDIRRFPNKDKLEQFAGIAPIKLSSSGKGKDKATKQGNRRLQAIIYFLAIQMVQVSSKGTPRNPAFRAYYEKRKAEGKSSQQALICISGRLINIIYGMLKNSTEYRMPVVENAGEKM